VPVEQVQIRFSGGQTALLAEAVPVDPFLHLRSAAWDTPNSPASASGTSPPEPRIKRARAGECC